MADVSWFEEHATPAGSGRRSTGRTSSKFKRAARRLARKGHRAQAGEFAKMAEMARLQEPSVMRPEFRQLDQAALDIKAMEDAAAAGGLDFEKDIAPLRGQFFQAVDSAGSLSPDEKQMLRDKHGPGFTGAAEAVDERQAKKDARDLAKKQADAAIWKQQQAEQAAQVGQETLDKLDIISDELGAWVTKQDKPPKAAERYQKRRELESKHLTAAHRNTQAYKDDHARRAVDLDRAIAEKRAQRREGIQTADALSVALAEITEPIVDSKGNTITIEQQRKEILQSFFGEDSEYWKLAEYLARGQRRKLTSTEQSALQATRKAVLDFYGKIDKDLDSMRDRNFRRVVFDTNLKGITTANFLNPDGFKTDAPAVIIGDLRTYADRAYSYDREREEEDPDIKRLLDKAESEIKPDGDKPPKLSREGYDFLHEAYNKIRSKVTSMIRMSHGPTSGPPKEEDKFE